MIDQYIDKKSESITSFFSKITSLFAIICSVSALTFSYFSYQSFYWVQQANQQRYESYLLAQQLRLSSDNLSLMARSYAVTGKAKYRQFYDDILAMRNGKKAWPLHYQRAYWDFLMPENGQVDVDEGETVSLIALMQQLNFTEDELQQLMQGLEGSNELTKIEYLAFAEVKKGLESDHYLLSVNRQRALLLLYNEEYLQAKAAIMEKINNFIQLQDLHTQRALHTAQHRHYIIVSLAMLSFFAMVIFLVYGLILTKENKRRFVDMLRKKVASRTFELFEKHEQLKTVIREMEVTKNQLVEAEKMASLGSLVSGVAHEVNTPLGIGVTLSSHLLDETNQLLQRVQKGELKRSDLDRYCVESSESCRLLLSNLERAANLISSFKQVAVDQDSDEIRRFKVSEYVQEVLVSLHPRIKKTSIKIQVDPVADEPFVETYPGAIVQIVTNLVMNALIHAFDGDHDGGHLIFKIATLAEDLLMTVSDDGKGMAPNVVNKIFDPFFTTQRGSGGSGLGMNIVYNLIVHQLQGTVQCQSILGKGSTFIIRFPINTNNNSAILNR